MRTTTNSHLTAWRDKGLYPAAYDQITHLALGHMKGVSLLDLGCAHGLLGYRISEEVGGARVCGIESNVKLIEEAERACVGVRFFHLHVSKATLPAVEEIIAGCEVDTLVVRNGMSEVFGQDAEAAQLFSDMIAETGVDQIFLEASTSLNDEVALFSNDYDVVKSVGRVAYLALPF